MHQFVYPTRGENPLSIEDFHRTFNSYRVWKYMIDMLLSLKKTELARYWILEPGCGDGSKLRFMTEMRARPHRCVGFDISSQAIESCRDLSPSIMHFQIASALDMAFADGTFDIVICSALFGCFMETSDIQKISREVRRVMKDDGILLVVGLTEDFPKIYTADFVARGFRWFDTQKDELEGLLSGEFSRVQRRKVFGCDRYSANGRFIEAVDLPAVEIAIDQKGGPAAYCLYSFVPKEN